jgi:hypothetical protein
MAGQLKALPSGCDINAKIIFINSKNASEMRFSLFPPKRVHNYLNAKFVSNNSETSAEKEPSGNWEV